VWWQLAAGVVLVAYALSLFAVHRPGNGYSSLWDGWAGNIAAVLPVVPVWLRVRHSSELRFAWTAMGFGVTLNAIADLVFLLHDQNLNPIPNPAPSDLVFLLSMTAFIVGVAIMTQSAFGRGHASVRLDGAVAGLAIGAIAVVLWFKPVLQVSGRPLQVAVGMAYPLCDLVLLVLLVAGLAPQRYRPTWSTGLLMLGIAWFVFGDIVYLNQTAANTYVPGTPLEATWAIGIFLIGVAAWAPSERRDQALVDRRTRARPGADIAPTGIGLVPVVFGILSLAVLVFSLFRHTSTVASALAVGALAFVIGRMALTLREVRSASVNFRDARTDVLTGLRNRRAFLEELAAQLLRVGEMQYVGVMLVDLDGFKEVNDSLGHHNGDELLRVVAQRFQRRLGDRGSIARLGGDEFASSCVVGNSETLIAIAHELAATLADPISLEGVTVRVGASIGVSLSPCDGETHADLLRTADVAMYEAKRVQSSVCSYHAEYDLNSRDRLTLINDLRTAIDDRTLTLHYQPTLAVRSATIHGVEALVRWHHPTRGLLYPDDFIPLAERVGLIPQLTQAVLALAVAEAARLQEAGHVLQMSVNISRYDLIDEHLPKFIDEILEGLGVPHDRFTLEITETCLSEEPERVTQQIEALRARGIRISIDDFGVGYSSMSQLLELPIDELKIDKSFVLALESDHRAEAIVRSTIELGRALNLTITAEGTECVDTLNRLRRLGTDIAQGYHIARPLTPEQLYEFLARPPGNFGLLPEAVPVESQPASSSPV
jgi:diguanylate cyclase